MCVILRHASIIAALGKEKNVDSIPTQMIISGFELNKGVVIVEEMTQCELVTHVILFH